MEYASKAVKGTVIVFVVSMLASLMGYFFRLILARNLVAAEYGLFYAVFSFIMLFSIFTDFGLSNAVVKFIPEFQVKKRPDLIKNSVLFIFIFQAAVTLIISAVLFSISGWLAANQFHEPISKSVFNLFLIAFFLSSLRVFISAIQGMQKPLMYSSLNLIRMASVFFVALVFIKLGFNIFIPVYAYIFAEFTVFVVSLLMFLKIFPKFFSFKVDFESDNVKRLFLFGIPVMLSSMGYIIIGYIDTIILTYFKPLEQVAMYNVAMPISLVLLWFIAYPLSTVLLPMVSEMWEKKLKNSLKHGMITIQKYVLAGIIPLALIFISFPDIIVRVLFGEQYVSAGIALQILSVGMIFYSLAFVNSNAISGIGKPKEITKILGFVALVNVVLNLILIPKYGFIGASIAVAITYFVMMIMTFSKLNKYIKLKLSFVYLIKTLLIGLIMVVVISYLKNLFVLNYVVESIVILIIAFLIYAVLLKFLKMIDFKEFFGLMKNAVKKN